MSPRAAERWALVLAGGRGERFWPLSTPERPKQLLAIPPGGPTLLERTLLRLRAAGIPPERTIVLTTRALREATATVVAPLLGDLANLWSEPESRDTGPAIAWALLELGRRAPAANLVGVFPADHWIEPTEAFAADVDRAFSAAEEYDAIVTLGIPPSRPATGYGYIERGDEVASGLYRVARFREKPDLETAGRYLASGRHDWNAGIFVFPRERMLAELAEHAPEILEPLRRSGTEAYANLPRRSIDYAVMEHTGRALLLPASFRWDDLGDWRALARLLPTDRAGNLALGSVCIVESRDTLVVTDPDQKLLVAGVDGLVVVRHGTWTLVMARDLLDRIKELRQRAEQNLEPAGP